MDAITILAESRRRLCVCLFIITILMKEKKKILYSTHILFTFKLICHWEWWWSHRKTEKCLGQTCSLNIWLKTDDVIGVSI